MSDEMSHVGIIIIFRCVESPFLRTGVFIATGYETAHFAPVILKRECHI